MRGFDQTCKTSPQKIPSAHKATRSPQRVKPRDGVAACEQLLDQRRCQAVLRERVVVEAVKDEPNDRDRRLAILGKLVKRMPVPIRAIRMDDGAEIMAGRETAYRDRCIALSVSPPRSPQPNGRVERLNGTAGRALWACYDGDLASPPSCRRHCGRRRSTTLLTAPSRPSGI